MDDVRRAMFSGPSLQEPASGPGELKLPRESAAATGDGDKKPRKLTRLLRTPLSGGVVSNMNRVSPGRHRLLRHTSGIPFMPIVGVPASIAPSYEWDSIYADRGGAGAGGGGLELKKGGCNMRWMTWRAICG